MPQAATDPKPEPDPRTTRAEGIDIRMSASGPVWVDTLAGDTVVTEAERVAAEQGSEDGEPIPESMEKDEYDEGLPDYGEANRF